jgi:hypothetical protein
MLAYAEAIMIWGMSTETFTLLHVIISLIAIASGILVLFGMIAGKRLDVLTALFLATTVLTSVTGFGFPFVHVTPGIVIGVISLVVLAIAIFARYGRNLTGGWRRTYVITASLALYFNVFVLVVQSFINVPALKALAPTQEEPPFAIAQLIVLVIFVGLTIAAAKRFREDKVRVVTGAAAR